VELWARMLAGNFA